MQDTDRTHQVSVVIPCYNSEELVSRTIRSAQAQGDVVVEIIVVNDGSTDGSLAVLQEHEAAGEITLITGPNKGGCHARNQGLAVAKAPYVAFLDADDLYEGPVLEGGVRAAQAAQADLIFSEMEIRFMDGRPSEYKGPLGPPEHDARGVFANWFDGDWVNPSATLWRTEFLRGIGGWNEAVRVGQDGEVALRAILEGAVVARNEEGRGIYHRGIAGSVSMTGGITPNKLAGHIDVMRTMCAAARAKGWGADLGRSYAALYFIARKSFMEGHIDLGRRALEVLRAEGHRAHHGTRAHVALASVIGLERKVRWFGS